MFGRRKKSKNTDEATLQSAMILDSLEMTDEVDDYTSELSEEEEDILAGLESQAEDDVIEEETKPRKRWGFFGRRKKDIMLYEEDSDDSETSDGNGQDESGHDSEEDDSLLLNPALFDLAKEMDEPKEARDNAVSLFAGDLPDDLSDDLPEDMDSLIGDYDIDALIGGGAGLGLTGIVNEGTDFAGDSVIRGELPPMLEEEETEEDLPAGETEPEWDDDEEEDDGDFEEDDDDFDDDDEDDEEEDSDDDGEDDEEEEGAEDDEDGAEDDDSDDSDDSDDEDSDDEYGDDDVIYYDDNEGKSKKKYLIGLAAGLVVLGLAAFFILQNMTKAPEGKVYVESVANIMGYDLSNTRVNRYSGVVEAQKQTKVTLEEGMTVSKCYVSVGDDVKKGDKLFKYDTEALNLQAQKKQLEIDQTNQKINSAQKKKDEYDKDARTAKGVDLLDAQQGSAEEELNIETYKLDLQAKKKELNSINKNIKNSVVKSPTNGKILKINTALGKGAEEAESENEQENTDNTYILIVAKGDYQVKAKITETNVQKDNIKAGDPVIIRSRITEDTWTGVIKSLRTDQTAEDESADTDDDSYSDSSSDIDTKYPCTINLDSSKGLMLGQHVLVELGQTAEADDGEGDGFWLDEAYVVEEGGEYYVYADNGNDRLVKKKIQVGEYDEESAQYYITGSLEKSDLIADTMNCQEGMATTTNQSEAIDQYESEDGDEEFSEEDYGDEDMEDMEDEEDLDSVDGLEIDE